MVRALPGFLGCAHASCLQSLGYCLIISDPDISFLGFGREFECFVRFEVCKFHAIIHDAFGAAKTIYNVGLDIGTLITQKGP